MSRTPSRAWLLVPLALAGACTEGGTMTNAEVLQALEQSRDSSRGEAATTEPIEISTSFTIGQAVEAAAEELAAFWESQQPCTTVTWDGPEVTIDYGGLDDTCEFNLKTYGGVAVVGVQSATLGELEVQHTWTALTDGEVEVNGGALVTWDGSDDTRHVATEHTWTDLDDGRTVDVIGDHTWGYIDPSAKLLGGFTLEGTRDWIDDDGSEWHIDMTDLELRLQDPVAQAGSIALTNPAGKTLDLVHERVDETTIRVTLTSGFREWVYDINALGIPTEVTEDDGATGT